MKPASRRISSHADGQTTRPRVPRDQRTWAYICDLSREGERRRAVQGPGATPKHLIEISAASIPTHAVLIVDHRGT